MPKRNLHTAPGSQHSCRHSLTAIVLNFALLPTLASAECATVEENQWISGRPYDQGALVYHDGQWFQARERQAGHEPGSGFSWKTVAEPDCSAANAAQDPADSERLATPLDAVVKPGKPTPEPRQVKQPRTTQVEMSSVKEPNEPVREDAKSETNKSPCPEVGAFSFGESYSPGALVRHQGQVYRAMRPSTGTMPSYGMPPHWEQHDSACAEN